ncbi:hypothetical protein [Gulosibacter bifidus]|uniref:Fe-S oxidoreductase n=1 Tax=Gulosibacter bifidus TaxID=272239 RepID=A0ABW5RIC6_9MICO|nr:hypothetical protein [Gulosibacter bifidus]
MQIGTRWPFGTPAPQSLPAAVRDALLQVERETSAPQWWTLTWLEGRPVVTADSGISVTVDASGTVRTASTPQLPGDDDDDDGWLAG